MLDRSLNVAVRGPRMPRPDAAPAAWATSAGLVPYREAEAFMEARASAIADGAAGEMVWLLEHPPLYTAGVSAKPADLLDPQRFPVFRSGRGGQFTYHGPGQRVAYVMLDLSARGRDVHVFVGALQAWIIEALARLGVAREDKVAAIGVKLRRWASFHGVSLNVDPDLGHFAGIVPCGVTAHGVTSLADLGAPATLAAADAALKAAFVSVFGPVADAPAPL
jgi:lipoyl(octanoyl) transferase